MNSQGRTYDQGLSLAGPDTVFFYDPVPPYGWLSTFSCHPVNLDGCIWQTVEHYFQAAKFTDPELRRCIRESNSPAEAKAIAQRYRVARRSDWQEIKEAEMLKVLRAKYQQHPELTALLMNTGNLLLVEDSDKDRYWGRGHDGTGLNRLGELLMTVRRELKDKQHHERSPAP